MTTATRTIEELANREYQYGFVTDVEAETVPKGLNEEVVRLISEKKREPAWLLEWRLKAYRTWLTMTEPTWQNVRYPAIDYQDIIYYSAPKKRPTLNSLDEVDPEIRATFEKLGIPLEEQKLFAGVAVDAVFDSVSVGTTFKKKLGDLGIIFSSFSEAVQEHPALVRKYLGTVVPYTDNFFATLNSAVFSDGSFAYIPKGVRCPMELSTYFRINAQNTGQFERTLIIADEGAYVSEPGLAHASLRGRREGRGRVDRSRVIPYVVSAFRRTVSSNMPDNIIKLIDEHAARSEEAARVASNAGVTAGAIFERRDPVKTLAMQPQILEVLSTIFDPEIPVNIYELGLIYEIAVDSDHVVRVRMTLTSPGCPAAQSLPVEVVNKLKQLPGITGAHVDIVWDPPWDKDRMSDAAKLQLGMF